MCRASERRLCSRNQPHAQEREEAREKREMERSQTILQRLHVLDDKLNFALKHTHTHTEASDGVVSASPERGADSKATPKKKPDTRDKVR